MVASPMSSRTSEQALSALEQSRKPAIDLLDDAADIIGLRPRPDAKGYESVEQSKFRVDTSAFREQWLLRWLIKQLIKAAQHDAADVAPISDLLRDYRTWHLLSHVLRTPPAYAIRDVLLERHFGQVFRQCLARLIPHLEAGVVRQRSASNSPLRDAETGRALKKRRLSSDDDDDDDELTDLILDLIQLLQWVSALLIDVLMSTDDDTPSRAQPLMRYFGEIDNSTPYLGYTLRLAEIALATFRPDQVEMSTPAIIGRLCEQCFDLWKKSTLAASSKLKQTLHITFNEHVLVPALVLLKCGSSLSNDALHQKLTRQIAVDTILPARSAFQKEHMNLSKTSERPDHPDLVQIMEAIVKPWGSTAYNLATLQNSDVAELFKIATRIVPRSDVTRRKAEAMWWEALWYVLAYLKVVPVKVQGKASSPQQSLFDNTRRSPDACAELLDALLSVGIEPSSAFWQYYVEEVMSTESNHIELETIAKVVTLNSLMFVPGATQEGTHLLEALATLFISRNRSKEEHDIFITQIIQPILVATTRSRKLSDFVTFWEARLVDTFHERATTTQTTSQPGPANRVWDDARLRKAFESVCLQYIPIPLYRNLCGNIVQTIESLPSLIGPSHQVFAQVTIFESALKAMAASPVIKSVLTEEAGSICKAVCDGLRRKSDYQGQRWQLWKVLDSTITLLQDGDRLQVLQMHSLKWPFLDISPDQLNSAYPTIENALLMEQLHSFCLSATVFELNLADAKTIFTKSLSTLEHLISSCIKVSSTRSEFNVWNGSFDGMSTNFEIVSACLIRLAAMPPSCVVSYSRSKTLLMNTMAVACNVGYSEVRTGNEGYDLSYAAEALLVSLSAADTIDVLDVFLNFISEPEIVVSLTHLPIIILQRCGQPMSRGQAHKMVTYLLGTKSALSTEQQAEAITGVLSSLSEILSNHPSAGDSHLSNYLSLTDITIVNSSLQQIITTSECIGKSMGHLLSRAISIPSVESRQALLDALELCYKKLKKATSKKKAAFLDGYGGFVVLEIIRQSSDKSCLSDNDDIRKAIKKASKRYQDVVFEVAKHYLENETTSINCFKVWKLLETFQCLEDSDAGTSNGLHNVLSELMQHISTIGADASSPGAVPSFERDTMLSILEQLGNSEDGGRPKQTAEALTSRLWLNTTGLLTCGTLVLQSNLLTNQQSCIATNDDMLQTLLMTTKQVCSSDLGRDQDLTTFLSLASLLKSVKAENIATLPEVLQELSQIACLQGAVEETNAVHLIARLELSKVILEKHDCIINQHIIDETLASIALIASTASKLALDFESTTTQPQPAHIFDRLCDILTSLLVRHRRRFSGRYSLLLPALQNLLKCLFYPPSRTHLNATPATYPSKVAFLSSLPHWLNPRSHTSTITLPASSAAKFSRLLQTLCDPSTSSARRTLSKRSAASSSSHLNLNLIDETRRLRHFVAQHTQFLLQTYCQATLDGHIAPEVKDKLTPGLYAVVGGMEIELMRTMNSAMDEAQRAIWKDLYADWMVWGKWNQQ